MAARKDDFVPTNLERVAQSLEGDSRKFWIDTNAAYLIAPSDFAKYYHSVTFVLQNYWATQNTNHRAPGGFKIKRLVR